MGALLAAISGKLGDALGGKVDLGIAGELGGGCAAQAEKMMELVSAEA